MQLHPDFTLVADEAAMSLAGDRLYRFQMPEAFAPGIADFVFSLTDLWEY